MEPDIAELQGKSMVLSGACSGVYFLFDKDELVYIGSGWNCFLRIAEHTRKEPHLHKTFTSWNFIPIAGEREYRALEKKFICMFNPRDNKTHIVKRKK